MPRNGAHVFSDLVGKLDVLGVACARCSRTGRYRVDRLIAEHGREGQHPGLARRVEVDVPAAPESSATRARRAAPTWRRARRRAGWLDGAELRELARLLEVKAKKKRAAAARQRLGRSRKWPRGFLRPRRSTG